MLHDFNANDNHLSAQRGGAGWSGVVAGASGLGRYAVEDTGPVLLPGNYEAGPDRGNEYVDYEDVTNTATASEVPVVPRTGGTMPAPGTLQLPQFNFSTGVSSCTDCTPTNSASAVATANAAAVVTPMADAPKSINWLLILGAAGIGYYFLKGNPKPGLGTLEPTPTVQDLGRPAPKPKAKPKHVANLAI